LRGARAKARPTVKRSGASPLLLADARLVQNFLQQAHVNRVGVGVRDLLLPLALDHEGMVAPTYMEWTVPAQEAELVYEIAPSSLGGECHQSLDVIQVDVVQNKDVAVARLNLEEKPVVECFLEVAKSVLMRWSSTPDSL